MITNLTQEEILDAFRKGQLIIAPDVTRGQLFKAFKENIIVRKTGCNHQDAQDSALPNGAAVEDQEIYYLVKKGTNIRDYFSDEAIKSVNKVQYAKVRMPQATGYIKKYEEFNKVELELIPVKDYVRITGGIDN
jgi:hypothetical protein